jgi:hypothetical protein
MAMLSKEDQVNSEAQFEVQRQNTSEGKKYYSDALKKNCPQEILARMRIEKTCLRRAKIQISEELIAWAFVGIALPRKTAFLMYHLSIDHSRS